MGSAFHNLSKFEVNTLSNYRDITKILKHQSSCMTGLNDTTVFSCIIAKLRHACDQHFLLLKSFPTMLQNHT